MLIGYARVSRTDQNLSLQTTALTNAGCERILEDTMSGSKASRPGLDKALDLLREGDTLMVWKLDRLGRSVGGLVELVNKLKKQGVHLKSLTDAIDTSSSSGMFFFQVMASMAEMERTLIIERTQAGLQAARLLGRVGGRPKLMNDSKVASAKAMLTSGIAPRDVATNLGISIPTLYRWVPATSVPTPAQPPSLESTLTQ